MGCFVDTTTTTTFELFSCKLLNMEHCTMKLIDTDCNNHNNLQSLAGFSVIQVL